MIHCETEYIKQIWGRYKCVLFSNYQVIIRIATQRSLKLFNYLLAEYESVTKLNLRLLLIGARLQ
jgi:hypothetical protein